jgi:hypothetical protein
MGTIYSPSLRYDRTTNEPSDVEEMIQRRLEEKNSPIECEDVLWPSTFCLAD